MIKKETVLKLLLLVILVTVMAFWANYLSGNEAFYKRALENRKEESYSGIVIEKYIDYHNIVHQCLNLQVVQAML